jgi:hypothetical protein
MSPDAGSGTPDFARRSARITDAYRFARDAHALGVTTIDHPTAVAELLADAGYPELAERFGPDVARLVA